MKSETNNMGTYFAFLDNLQDSGVTNMFGAAPYLIAEFGVTRSDARDIVLAWMKAVTERKTVYDRRHNITAQGTHQRR